MHAQRQHVPEAEGDQVLGHLGGAGGFRVRILALRISCPKGCYGVSIPSRVEGFELHVYYLTSVVCPTQAGGVI